jgi:hypothetical protein
MKRFYPITVHSGCRGYNVGNQLSVEWQRPVTIFIVVFLIERAQLTLKGVKYYVVYYGNGFVGVDGRCDVGYGLRALDFYIALLCFESCCCCMLNL